MKQKPPELRCWNHWDDPAQRDKECSRLPYGTFITFCPECGEQVESYRPKPKREAEPNRNDVSKT